MSGDRPDRGASVPTDWNAKVVVHRLGDGAALTPDLVAALERLSNPETARPLVLDFSDVSYMASSHLAEVLRIRKRATERRTGLVLCGLSEHIWSVMLLTGLDRILRTAPGPEAAQQMLLVETDTGGAI
ncbi:MAG: STAS domain-containing protein [Phycisphaerales bacterium]|jgi:anti-anti-sigma factor|nr:STAS domain-containing protein [Phycisphaerales bacterium]